MLTPHSPAVAALGGGHGLAASLSALRLMTDRITAIVTVADDGGSSGRLRRELDVLPPGDLRMALAALCDDTQWGKTWSSLLQYRFNSNGALDNHAMGNLLIVALWDQLGDPVAGLDWVGKLLNARGRVLPMATIPLNIEADIEIQGETRLVTGQAHVARASGTVKQVRLFPEKPPVCEEAVSAILEADWIVLGPGSWFSSVMPHLVVPQIRQAISESKGKRCLTLNLVNETAETVGMSVTDHLRAIQDHAPELKFDVVVADPSAVDDLDELSAAVSSIGAKLLLRQVSIGDGTERHDALRLAAAYRDAFVGAISDIE